MSRVLRAAPLILWWEGQYTCTYQHRDTDEQQGRPPDRTPPPQHPEERTPEGEWRTCSPYKQSGGSSRFSPPGPAFSLQREYLSVVSGGGGSLGGSWSGLPWLSYTSRGTEPKIRFLTSSPRRASWCLVSPRLPPPHWYRLIRLRFADTTQRWHMNSDGRRFMIWWCNRQGMDSCKWRGCNVLLARILTTETRSLVQGFIQTASFYATLP